MDSLQVSLCTPIFKQVDVTHIAFTPCRSASSFELFYRIFETGMLSLAVEVSWRASRNSSEPSGSLDHLVGPSFLGVLLNLDDNLAGTINVFMRLCDYPGDLLGDRVEGGHEVGREPKLGETREEEEVGEPVRCQAMQSAAPFFSPLRLHIPPVTAGDSEVSTRCRTPRPSNEPDDVARAENENVDRIFLAIRDHTGGRH
ncbi:unnamed protein product [Mycena citricolor]|uniref:Uncharacterized protein n=1 Tax=Mycena citricolor TaxID=2018698 RepID=A0AAD2Q7H5_9AGAR|nr:unnamed protein product [Mycena citricolor]CAK5284290.1 unnamed protein product [Mycena citricolor]